MRTTCDTICTPLSSGRVIVMVDAPPHSKKRPAETVMADVLTLEVCNGLADQWWMRVGNTPWQAAIRHQRHRMHSVLPYGGLLDRSLSESRSGPAANQGLRTHTLLAGLRRRPRASWTLLDKRLDLVLWYATP